MPRVLLDVHVLVRVIFKKAAHQAESTAAGEILPEWVFGLRPTVAVRARHQDSNARQNLRIRRMPEAKTGNGVIGTGGNIRVNKSALSGKGSQGCRQPEQPEQRVWCDRGPLKHSVNSIRSR